MVFSTILNIFGLFYVAIGKIFIIIQCFYYYIAVLPPQANIFVIIIYSAYYNIGY